MPNPVESVSKEFWEGLREQLCTRTLCPAQRGSADFPPGGVVRAPSSLTCGATSAPTTSRPPAANYGPGFPAARLDENGGGGHPCRSHLVLGKRQTAIAGGCRCHWTRPEPHPASPSICLVEITYLAEKGRLDMAVMPRILTELDDPATTLELAAASTSASYMPWQDILRSAVDMPDRIIAATAFHHCVPLVTRDSKIRSCGIDTIW